jgi:hypothetical protein
MVACECRVGRILRTTAQPFLYCVNVFTAFSDGTSWGGWALLDDELCCRLVVVVSPCRKSTLLQARSKRRQMALGAAPSASTNYDHRKATSGQHGLALADEARTRCAESCGADVVVNVMPTLSVDERWLWCWQTSAWSLRERDVVAI